MKGISGWSYAPYAPLVFDVGEPYICRVAPGETDITFEWLPLDNGAEYEIYCAPRGETPALSGRTRACGYVISALEKDTEYVFYVECAGRRSRERLAHTGTPEGTIVNYLHPEDGCYSFSGLSLCSPSLIRHPCGCLLASMDVYENGAPQNLTLIYRSDDDGKSWRYVSELMPCCWGRLFIHNDALYMLACSTEYGDLLIGRSDDAGRTFTAPAAILRGAGKCDRPGVHKNPQPLVEYNGRLWCTLEWGAWALRRHDAMVMSAPVDADLLNPENWRLSAPAAYDPAWQGVGKGDSAGNIEGTLVIAPDGKLYNVMRYDMTRMTPNYGLALAYLVDTEHPDSKLTFARALSFPGNHSKFEIRYDDASGRYYSIVSRILNSDCAGNRNLLSLIASTDLSNWTLIADLIDRRNEDPQKIGFQYADFIIEGDDLIYLCRTAINGARNYHDANQSTFHRVQNFRSL